MRGHAPRCREAWDAWQQAAVGIGQTALGITTVIITTDTDQLQMCVKKVSV